MSDPDEIHLDRLLPLMPWLGFDQYSFGTLEQARELIGVNEAGTRVTLIRAGPQHWDVKVADQESGQLLSAEIVERALKGALQIQEVVIVPDIAAQLFHAALDRVAVSLNVIDEALEEVKVMVEAPGWPHTIDERFGKILADALASSTRAALAAPLLAFAAGEAQVNTWMDIAGAPRDLQRRSLANRARWLLGKAHHEGVSEESVIADIERCISSRHALVHSRPIEQRIKLGESAPSSSLLFEARASCLAVRRLLTALARALELTRPEFVDVCPDLDPEDVQAWREALAADLRQS